MSLSVSATHSKTSGDVIHSAMVSTLRLSRCAGSREKRGEFRQAMRACDSPSGDAGRDGRFVHVCNLRWRGLSMRNAGAPAVLADRYSAKELALALCAAPLLWPRRTWCFCGCTAWHRCAALAQLRGRPGASVKAP